MKISTMLRREDFYSINEETLNGYYGCHDAHTKLYIYPNINAIVTKRPGKAVRDYLLCEFSVRGNWLRRFAAKIYVYSCLMTGGLLAAKSFDLAAPVSRDTLIYPCNKKYRIFDFGKNEVSVVVKAGFGNGELQHEIAFRNRPNNPDFVPRLYKADANGYTETIIDGKPLARIEHGFEEYREKAYALLAEYGKDTLQTVSAEVYCANVLRHMEEKLAKEELLLEKLHAIYLRLRQDIPDDAQIPVCFSHGDFQAGNIWVENGTKKIYIIDWESWGQRSEWYDRAVLFKGLRPYGLKQYFFGEKNRTERAVVLLEELAFRIDETDSLPKSFGGTRLLQYLNSILSMLDR